MSLSDPDIERYARQIVIPGIGARGQEILLAATVAVFGCDEGRDQAALYLRAAGAKVTFLAQDGIAAIILAGVSSIDEAIRDFAIEAGVPVCWYELSENGFLCGVHPQAPFPLVAPLTANIDPAVGVVLHQTAACDAAAAACACILSLPCRSGPNAIEILG